ncbi:MAG: TIGR03118 family protein [Bryobacteraceae bacterium]
MTFARVTSVAACLCAGAFAQSVNSYTQTNLSSDIAGLAKTTDTKLINPWGLSRPTAATAAEAHWWAADQATGVSTLYDADGSVVPLTITIPPASGAGTGSPTGTVFFNKNFVFVTLDGTISQWFAGTKPAIPGTGCAKCHVLNATLQVNHSSLGASYTGITFANNGGVPTYYAANSAGGVEAYDSAYNQISLASGAFADPKLPATYKPFGIQAVGARIYVTFSQPFPAPGGFVDAFDTTGKLLVRLQSGSFNEPWGIAKAPSNFGAFSNMILVGNVGSGWIGAYNASTGKFQGFLSDSSGNPITNLGLWAISFGAGNTDSGPTNVLYFNAGIQGYQHGLFGAISAN